MALIVPPPDLRSDATATVVIKPVPPRLFCPPGPGTNVSSQARQGRASPRHLQTPRFKRIQVWRELADSRRAGLQDDELEPLAREQAAERASTTASSADERSP